MADPRTMFDKIWDQHAILTRDDGQSLLWIDRHYLHEGSFHAFDTLARRALGVARPELAVAVADHYVPTRGSAPPAMAEVIARLTANTAAHGIRLFGQGDPRQGIVHVTGLERGLTLPGMSVVCGDSHTSTHGAIGALAFGIGASEVAHVLATQTLWQRRPRRMRVTVGGQLAPGVTAKDLALTLIARLGSDGGRGHAIEYAGPAVRALSMEGRLTLCNMTIECGARCGMIAPDEVTRAWLQAEWQTDWTTLATDPGAAFDREVTLDAIAVAPTVTWGTNPADGLPIDAFVPDPAALEAPRAAHVREALDYMGLRPGQALAGLAVDRVFIGSCTNGRIEDLRAAAAVLAGRRAVVPGLVSPGSAAVKAQAEREGIDRIVLEAGLEWGEAGCSMCVGMNGDVVAPGQRCASTTTRNFRGRQGPGARTHLMSPAMAATAAVMGRLSDVRNLTRSLADHPRAPIPPAREGGRAAPSPPCGRGSA